jgi:hypothetical protein
MEAHVPQITGTVNFMLPACMEIGCAIYINTQVAYMKTYTEANKLKVAHFHFSSGMGMLLGYTVE